jgi:CHAT domain-containing protein/tetratricopeptide (TPR) repeat protein
MRLYGKCREAASLTKIFIVAAFILANAECALADDVDSLNTRVLELYQSGRYADALPLAERYVRAVKSLHGAESPLYSKALVNLGEVYVAEGRYAEAEPILKLALAVEENALGPDHPDLASRLNNLGGLHLARGRYADAERLYRRALAIDEKALGAEHADVAIDLNNLAFLYEDQGRYDDAEPLYKHALTITENTLGSEHPKVGIRLNNLASLYEHQGRYSEAESLYIRALALGEHTLRSGHPDIAARLNNLARLYRVEGRYDEAEPIYRRALAINEKELGPNHPVVAIQINNLAVLYESQGRYFAAESLYRRALAIGEKTLGSGHPDVATRLTNLGTLYYDQGRYDKAEPLLRRSLLVDKKALGPEHPSVGIDLNNLAALRFRQRDWSHAADFWRRSTGVMVHRVLRGTQDLGRALKGKAIVETEQTSWRFRQLIKAQSHLVFSDRDGGKKLERDTFQTAQWAQNSEAARSLMQMAARGAKGDPVLGALVRERQDLVSTAAVSRAPNQRNAQAEAANAARIRAIDLRITAVDERLKHDFPDYAAFASPEPLSVDLVRGELRADEALVLILDTSAWRPTPEESFIWIVTKDQQPRWVRSELGTPSLKRLVGALRCGLDEEEWGTVTKAVRCGELLGQAERPDSSRPLPFDLGKAHELYQALFGQVEDLIKGKHLIVVSSGPLSSLPFQVLVTKRPDTALPSTFEGYRNVAWLGRSHAISVLPAVSSLKALRVDAAKGAKALDDYLGYGNPVLTGAGRSCRATQIPDQCPTIAVHQQVVAANDGARATIRGLGGQRSGKLDEMFAKGAAAEVVLEQVRALCPLPDTAYEIRCVSEYFKPRARRIRLGHDATKEDINALSESGALARYRIVHFATHGLVSGDVEAMANRQGEPALVLTPPDQPKDINDNGLLLASEVAQLKLNADWVVLSACNTAAGEKLGSEALSGLARAFFYAGARALLVSHWPVYSDAAVQLTIRALAELDRNPKAGRAEALQQAMIELMDDPALSDNAHPAVWAPFVVVGEGWR